MTAAFHSMPWRRAGLATLLASVAAAAFAQGVPAPAAGPATEATVAANRRVLGTLPFTDQADFEDARRGFVGGPAEDEILRNAQGNPVWNFGAYRFIDGQAPDTVNPSLWRQATLNRIAGLFKVTERVYQVRGYDLSNMNVIEGDTGLIVMDPLVSAETAKAALELYYRHRPRKPVVAVIYTHSHGDHFGGVKGVVDEADVAAGKVRIYAPSGFMEEAISENVMAGNAMSRRAQYMYGAFLARSATGHVDAGIGKAASAGSITLIAPTDLIDKALDTRTIDGVQVEFQLAPETEAPAEMHLFFPQFKVLCMAENATHSQHNILTPRGAQVRDAQKWSQQVDAARLHWGGQAEILIAQHTWPMWGGERIDGFLADTRDMYAYLHDQTVRLLNKGYTPTQISDAIRALPPRLANKWHAREYYGTISYNVRAIYQRYLGFFDGNPANLDPLPPVETARRTIAWMGGADAVLARARESFARGDYRWVAQIVGQLVYAEPGNAPARRLQADTLEQLGYQAESAVWRNFYLTGAKELRDGITQRAFTVASPDIVRAMTPEMIFDFMAVRVNAEKLGDEQALINWRFADGQRYATTLRNRVLTVQPGREDPRADATVSLPRAVLAGLAAGALSLDQAVAEGKVRIDGQAPKVALLLSSLDTFRPNFPIVTPAVER